VNLKYFVHFLRKIINICNNECDNGSIYIRINGIYELKDCNDCTGNNKDYFRCGSECYLLCSGVCGR
jgi:hypothetical protein